MCLILTLTRQTQLSWLPNQSTFSALATLSVISNTSLQRDRVCCLIFEWALVRLMIPFLCTAVPTRVSTAFWFPPLDIHTSTSRSFVALLRMLPWPSALLLVAIIRGPCPRHLSHWQANKAQSSLPGARSQFGHSA